MADSIGAALAGGAGLPRPGGNPNAASGIAAPATPGKPAGNPSTPSADDAIVAAKKQAEHWRNKYERDVGDAAALKERLAKLEGLADGISAGSSPSAPKNPQSWSDVDDAGLSEAIKRGMEESNPSLIDMATQERVRRATQKVREDLSKEAEERAQSAVRVAASKQQELSRIVNDFGAEVHDMDSELRKAADAIFYEKTRQMGEERARSTPGLIYDCFAQADRNRLIGQRAELDQLRQQNAQFQARQEFERGTTIGAARSSADVTDLLKQGKRKEAMRLALEKAQRK